MTISTRTPAHTITTADRVPAVRVKRDGDDWVAEYANWFRYYLTYDCAYGKTPEDAHARFVTRRQKERADARMRPVYFDKNGQRVPS